MKSSPHGFHLFTKQGFLDGSAVREARVYLGWSQAELADAARVDRTAVGRIESDSPRKRQATTVKKICEALGAEHHPGDVQKIEALASKLHRTFHGYHVTHRRDQLNPQIVETYWSVKGSNECSLQYLDTALMYSGGYRIEAEGRLVFELDCDAPELTEHMVWRFSYPIASEMEILKGSWYGIDYFQKPCTGAAILSHEPLDPEEQKRQLLSVPPYQASLIDDTPNEISSLSGWDNSLLEKAFDVAEHGDHINLISSFYPDYTWLDCQFRRYIGTAMETNRTRIKIRILFFDYRIKDFIEKRFKNRNDYSGEEVKAEIERQAKRFLELDQIYSGVNVEVRFFSSWPFGMSYQVSNRMICFGLLFGSESAISGPMLIVDNERSKSWKMIEADFEKAWIDAIDSHEVLEETS